MKKLTKESDSLKYKDEFKTSIIDDLTKEKTELLKNKKEL